MTSGTDSRRAAPLPADERRAAIVTAALPLMRRLGTEITTRQIAEAAGVAEGTIFRVFPDKAAVLRASFEQAWDPARAEADLSGIAEDLDLPDRLTQIVQIIETRVAEIWQLFSMARAAFDPDRPGDRRGTKREHSGHRSRAGRSPDHLQLREQGERRMAVAVARALAPANGELRISPAAAARLISPLVFGCVHPQLADRDRLNTADIVDFLLDGLRARPGTPPEADPEPPAPPAGNPPPPPTPSPPRPTARTSC